MITADNNPMGDAARPDADEGARLAGETMEQAGARASQATRKLGEASEQALAFGQEAMSRQLAAWQAIWAASNPTELVRAQVAFGRESLETYLALSQRSSQLVLELLTAATPVDFGGGRSTAPSAQ